MEVGVLASFDDRVASMGPPSENGGYGGRPRSSFRAFTLQWVHRPRTVVMQKAWEAGGKDKERFNGSTVRERWLCVDLALAPRRGNR